MTADTINCIFNGIIALGIVNGFWQIRLSKNIAKDTNKRESIKFALEQCDMFQREIIKEFNLILNFHEINNINFLDREKLFNEEGELVNSSEDFHDKTLELLEMAMVLFNKMDVFASYFINNSIADEEIGYNVQGRAYCDVVDGLENIYKLFISLKGEDYKSLSSLYVLWKNKQQK